MIFVDSSAWYASSTTRDTNHAAAAQFLCSVREPLVTTDYVVDETLTLFRVRSENRHALTFGAEVIDGSFAEIVAVTDLDFAAAWDVFQRFNDKKWSFTDCTSRVVMHRHSAGVRVRRALSAVRDGRGGAVSGNCKLLDSASD